MRSKILNKRNTLFAAMTAALVLPVGAQAGAWGDKYFEKADANKDGALSKEELQAARADRMQGADADKDGFITSDEMAAHHAARMEAKKDEHFTRFSEKFDTNKDGKVSTAEIEAHESPFFDKADANSDGKLTKEELEAAKSMKHDHDGDKGAD